MKLYCLKFFALSLSLLSFDVVADTTSEETETTDSMRGLVMKKNKTQQVKRKNARKKFRKQNNRQRPNDWSVPNSWKEPNSWSKPDTWSSPPKHEYTRVVVMESGCIYNYVSTSNDTPEADFPISLPDGAPQDGGTWTVGSHVFRSCDLFDKSKGTIPLKVGQTNGHCLVIDVTSTDPDNDATLECTIVDELVSEIDNMYSYGTNTKQSDLYSEATIRSEGTMKGWGENFKAATIGGTGGGIKASGQMEFIESEYSGQYVHFYYIDAPYLKKGFRCN